MPTPFDHLPKFQKLPPEAQQLILKKFNEKSEAEQMQIMGKIKTPMAAVDNDPGLQDKSMEVAFEVASAVPALKAAPAAIKGGIGLAKGGVGAIGKGLSAAKNLVLGEGREQAALRAKQMLEPVQDRLLKQSAAIQGVPVRQMAREASLMAEKSAIGKAIGQAEELGGYAIKDTPESFARIMKDPKELNKMASTLRKIADTPSEQLTKMDTQSLQTVRKFAQTFREMGPETTSTIKANIKMGGGKSTEALKQIDPVFKSVMDDWERVAAKLDRLPDDAIKQKAAMKDAMIQTRLAIKRTQRLNDVAIAAGAKRDAVRKALIQAGIPSALLGGLLYKMTGK